jgi:tetratricopeptide (TPR) repeat protein
MVSYRYFVTSMIINLLLCSCGNLNNSSGSNIKQVVQKTNVTELIQQVKTSQQSAKLFIQANSLLNSHHYQHAIALYDQVLQIEPNKSEALINRGNALASLQRYEDAIASYNKAIHFQPKAHQAWYNRGNALMAWQQYEDAIASYRQALSLKPDKYEAWINQGISLAKLQRYQEAVAIYDHAIALNPKKDIAYYNKACAYALQNNIDLTLENLQKAVKIAPIKNQKQAKTDIDFAKVRENQRFQKLLNPQEK